MLISPHSQFTATWFTDDKRATAGVFVGKYPNKKNLHHCMY
jgi:hypothetical protein